MRIAVIGVSQVAELASSWVATARPARRGQRDRPGPHPRGVRTAKRLASIVIVFMHWGTEGQACPDPAQLTLARQLAAAGASIIIGAHAHMLQGSGWLGRTFVAYGLGDFLWWERSYSTATGVLELTVHPRAPLTARFIPAVVSGTGQPIADRGVSARQAAAHYASLRHARSWPRGRPSRPREREADAGHGDATIEGAGTAYLAGGCCQAPGRQVRAARRHRATMISSSTSRRNTGGPVGIRRHWRIRRLRLRDDLADLLLGAQVRYRRGEPFDLLAQPQRDGQELLAGHALAAQVVTQPGLPGTRPLPGGGAACPRRAGCRRRPRSAASLTRWSAHEAKLSSGGLRSVIQMGPRSSW